MQTNAIRAAAHDRTIMLFNGFMAAAMTLIALQVVPKGTVVVPIPQAAAPAPAAAQAAVERTADDISAEFQAML
ncbi:MAG TPA: hypothetical protein VFP44_25030 [Usitatibacter sp.]|nr:hypothetical protein [Usitatibacter sp.]